MLHMSHMQCTESMECDTSCSKHKMCSFKWPLLSQDMYFIHSYDYAYRLNKKQLIVVLLYWYLLVKG